MKAAKTYFNKPLEDLASAEAAILAAIPQSPTKFDLTKNAEEVCAEVVPEGGTCTKFNLVVPATSEVVVRRNYILDRMKTYSPLSGKRHTLREYESRRRSRSSSPRSSASEWKAPHFVWQVRNELARLPRPAGRCLREDRHQRLGDDDNNLGMQGITEKWVYAASRAPNMKAPTRSSTT